MAEGSGAWFRCLECGGRMQVGDTECDACGHAHVDAEELWAIAVLSPFVFLLFAVLVLWALETLLPDVAAMLDAGAVVIALAAIWIGSLLQFGRDHLAYRRRVARAVGADEGFAGLRVAALRPPLEDRLERLRVTVKVGAAAALVGLLGGPLGATGGYGTALAVTELAGVGLLGLAAAETYRHREELRLRHHLARLRAATERTVGTAAEEAAGAARRGARGAAPYLVEVARGSRSVATDLRRTAVRIDEARRRLSRHRVPVGREGVADTAAVAERAWVRSIGSVERHWPAWGVAAVVELWTIAFVTGVGVTYLAETMLVTWLAFTYFLFEDVAITRSRYDWDPWWWSYSVLGLLPIVNIGVGTVYLLRREIVRRGRDDGREAGAGEDEEAGDGADDVVREARRPDGESATEPAATDRSE